MRRGHGIGGWRNENPRHFRPRGGGPPRYGPHSSYPLLELPVRFAGPRLPRGGPRYNAPQNDHLRHDHQERNIYDRSSVHGNQRRNDRDDRGHERHSYSQSHLRYNDTPEHSNPYKDMLTYCGGNRTNSDQYHMNNMGDVDHRQSYMGQNQKPFNQTPSHSWSNSPIDRRQTYEERSHNRKPYRQYDNAESSVIPTFTGHRPPSSDHYGSDAGSGIDNSNTFSRSVDDTVDIIRKRMLNRNDPHSTSDTTSVEQNLDDHRDNVGDTSNTYSNDQQGPPVKKRIQRPRQNVKSNCDKMKNKIVHQLFKMDKDKIHKLMDNPSSSSKFEYAISSLITESQNSLDRHLRSVAEKSLCSSSEEYIHNDNNTIYEDTFMKQMQCILEPQDTILLEDIKPLVMAELNKVLQLDEFDQRFEIGEEPNYYPPDEQQDYMNYANEYEYKEFSGDNIFNEYNDLYYKQQQFSENKFQVETESNPPKERGENSNLNYEKPLFERRPPKQSCDSRQLKQISSEDRQHSRKSAERDRKKYIEDRKRPDTPVAVFDTSLNQLSEDEDPFAGLDAQYHVPVDHNFIEAELDKQYNSAMENSFSDSESTSKMQLPETPKRPKTPVIKKEINNVIVSPETNPIIVKQEIDSQILNIAKSPLKLCPADRNDSQSSNSMIDSECADTPIADGGSGSSKTKSNKNEQSCNVHIKRERNNEPSDADKESKKSENSSNTSKTILPSNPRKRSTDQKPSHRKEKRKKSDTTESNKQILNKNIIINVNDCASKSKEKCDNAKSIFNLYFPKDNAKEIHKDGVKVETSDKEYSDKYVKRKETPKKPEHKRSRSHSSSHSNVSPKENINISNQTSTKSEPKVKLKPIDMFGDQPKKTSSIHQAHRNTAQVLSTPKKLDDKKSPTDSKTKTKRHHVSTQVLRKLHTKETQTSLSSSFSTRFTQTDVKKHASKAIQTDAVKIEKPTKTASKSSDAFERMKEIDLEIQVLLQEKFKLYNSLESKESCSDAMQNLGMTVLNVTPIDDDKEGDNDELSEDIIVNEFTSIPVEELEQIALETVQTESPKTVTRSRRQKVLDKSRKSSASPAPKKVAKKATAPNISLIEQIITDDRPLEDIISLDDLESPAKGKKKKTQKPQKTKKKATKKSKVSQTAQIEDNTEFIFKECSVVLLREDLSKYLPIPLEAEPELEKPDSPAKESNEAVEETVVNDIHFDMLDVSEDIVIGDICEIKNDKDAVERVDVSISEDIILDNSQSSCDDVVPLAAQNDEECKMFDYSSDDNLKRDSVTVTGNADAVLAIEYIDNDFIAACLDGNVYHFNAEGQLQTTLRGSNLAVTCLTIVKEKYGTTVYTGSLDSRIRYYDLETGLEKGPECNVLSPIQTMDRAWDTVFVGTRTGFVLQFECKNNMLIPVSTVKFSEQSILALRALKEGPRKVLLVAARSENVTIKDAQTGLLLRTLEGPKMTVYTLLFEDGKVYCGTSSHQIHVFDYSSGSHCGTHEGGKGAVCLRATGGLLFAGCYDGCVYVYREGEARPFAQLRGPSLMLLSLAVRDTQIIAGYKDRSLYIWKIPLSILKEMVL